MPKQTVKKRAAANSANADKQKRFRDKLRAAGFIKVYIHKADKPTIDKLNAKRKIPVS